MSLTLVPPSISDQTYNAIASVSVLANDGNDLENVLTPLLANMLPSLITDATMNSRLVHYAPMIQFNALSKYYCSLATTVGNKADTTYVEGVQGVLNTSVSNLTATVNSTITN